MAGALLAGGMTVFGAGSVYGVPGGLLGLALNLLVCVAGSLLRPAPDGPAAAAERSDTGVRVATSSSATPGS